MNTNSCVKTFVEERAKIKVGPPSLSPENRVYAPPVRRNTCQVRDVRLSNVSFARFIAGLRSGPKRTVRTCHSRTRTPHRSSTERFRDCIACDLPDPEFIAVCRRTTSTLDIAHRPCRRPRAITCGLFGVHVHLPRPSFVFPRPSLSIRTKLFQYTIKTPVTVSNQPSYWIDRYLNR